MKVLGNVAGVERDVVTRGEAMVQGMTRYFTGKPCLRGHMTERQVSDWTCCECNRLKQLVENMTPEQIERARERQRTENMTPEKVTRRNEQQRDYKARSGYGRKASMSPEAYARLNERVARNALFREGRVGQSKRLPWFDADAVVSFYVLANQLTAESGVVHHVDHIVALACSTASGLHVQTNLRVMPGAENIGKGAKLDEALALDSNPPQCTLASCACGARAALFTPGIVDKRKRVTQMLGERAESVVKQAIDMALAGDPVALPIVLARIAPALKPTDEAAPFQLDVSLPLEQQGLAVLRAIAAGDLTPDQGERMLKLVHSIASLRDVDTLTRRLDELEREVRSGKNTGTPGNVQRT